MSKKTILKGTLILTTTGLITKLLGFYYRIFLTRLIGVRELGVYQLIFPIYILMFSFCGQGIATALTKHVSGYMGKKEAACTKAVFRYALRISLLLSVVLSAVVFFRADGIASAVLKNSACAPLLRLLCIAVPFVCIKACINAYFMGLELPAKQGITQLFEQLIRITSAAVLAGAVFRMKKNAFLAVCAVVTGEITATLLAAIFFCAEHNKQKKKAEKRSGSCTVSVHKSFLCDAVPMTANSLMFTLFASLEAILMPAMLYAFYNDKGTAMEMFGIINGIVIPFLLFPSTVTTSLSSMLLPAVSYANARNAKRTIQKTLSKSVLFCLLLGVSAALGYRLLGEPVCVFAFHNEQAGTLLKNISFLCPLIYLSGTLSAIMNGMNLAFQNLIHNIIGIVIRILFSVLLIPRLGVPAYILGMTVSYLFVDISLLVSLYRKTSDYS